MSFFRQPKQPDPVTPPNPADMENRIVTARQRRLASGGRNATALAQMVSGGAAQASGAPAPRAPNTLTGLNG